MNLLSLFRTCVKLKASGPSLWNFEYSNDVDVGQNENEFSLATSSWKQQLKLNV